MILGTESQTMDHGWIAPEAIELFCEKHSSLPSVVCEELAEYTRANVPMSIMLSTPLVGGWLGFLAHQVGAKRTLDIGCFTGYSALCVAETLPSDGKVIALDNNLETGAIARRFWEKSPHGYKITLLEGDAANTLKKVEGPFDFVFLDADKKNYRLYAELALEKMSPKGILVADNCLYGGKVVDPNTTDAGAKSIQAFNHWVKETKTLRAVLLPMGDGLFLIQKR